MRSFRTPAVLRGFLLATTTIFPVLFAPYFAQEADAQDTLGARVTAHALEPL